MTAHSGSLLGQTVLFEGVSEEVTARCAEAFVQRSCRRHTGLFEQGDTARMIYLITQGKVRIARLSEDGDEVTVAIVGAGDMFGEEVLFDADIARSTVATCIEDSFICMSRAEDVFALMSRYPIIAVNMARYLKGQCDRARNTIEDLAYSKVSSRLMHLFERLAAEHGSASKLGTRIDMRLTHAEIASLIGSTRETVTLELGHLVRSGSIAIDGRYYLLRSRAQNGGRLTQPA
jgi:CRP/FNR family transcriptional regulator, cyclic AMP receptor protein